MAVTSWKWVVLVISICLLCVPAVDAAPIKKKAKIELKQVKGLNDVKTQSFKKTGFAEIKKADSGPRKVKKSFDLKFEKGAKFGNKILKNKKKSEVTFLVSPGGSKVKREKKLKLVSAVASDTKVDKFVVPGIQLVLDIDGSGLISGFSLDWLTDGKPVGSMNTKGLSIGNLSVRVPEPTTILLLGTGLFGLACVGRRKRKVEVV